MFAELEAPHKLEEFSRKRTGVGTHWTNEGSRYEIVGHKDGKILFKREDGRLKALSAQEAIEKMTQIPG